jgi:hypothetical protein
MPESASLLHVEEVIFDLGRVGSWDDIADVHDTSESERSATLLQNVTAQPRSGEHWTHVPCVAAKPCHADVSTFHSGDMVDEELHAEFFGEEAPQL